VRVRRSGGIDVPSLSEKLTAASWDLAAHTAAKLKILSAYLQAWFPIVGRSPSFDRVIYIDGFAGPGRYKQGEDGSPIIALKAAIGAINDQIRKPFEFHFVERRHRVAAALKDNIKDLQQRHQTGLENIQVYIHPEKLFQAVYEELIRARLQAYPRAAAFALVDPFGWTGIPLSVMSDLMKRPGTEILVNFMFEEINRFIKHPDQGHNFDSLFGCREWRQAESMAGGERKKFIVDLYRDQLSQRCGARHVRSFEMRNQRNATDYFLYFASNNRLGLSKMKEAMWKVDPGGGFIFSDATNFDQSVLFQPEPDRHALRRMIVERFANRRATIQQIENFVVDDTPFLDSHYKKVLATMESEAGLEYIDPPSARRRGTYANKAGVIAFQ
jgi:three-Cys-motif partner protein